MCRQIILLKHQIRCKENQEYTICGKMSGSTSSPTQQSINPNPNLKSSKNILHIGGIPVEFPYQPYGTQLAFMNRVISTLDRSQRDGNCHALLESPTGTGKSLSLLCSTIAWQQNRKSKNLQANLTHSSSKPNPEATTDPINHGGGFIPETQPSGVNYDQNWCNFVFVLSVDDRKY